MKIIVTHTSPDLDAITAVWLIKRFLNDWEKAEVQFVPAGEKLKSAKFANENLSVGDSSSLASELIPRKSRGSNIHSSRSSKSPPSSSENFVSSPHSSPIENIKDDQVIHVDTGFGPLDHHQTEDEDTSAASLTFDFIEKTSNEQHLTTNTNKEEAVLRIVNIITEIDHFKEVFWENPTLDRHEFSLLGILEGLKIQKPGQDQFYIDFIMQCLDAILHDFESRVWAEKEIAEKGIKFQTKWGEGIGIETVNDTVMKLAQKMGYVIVVRKDPRKGYVRINAKPSNKRLASSKLASSSGSKEKLNAKRYTLDADIDLTLVCEKLKKIDPEATWFLHVSKKILLNGSVKNPKMRPTNLSLREIINVLEKI